jgi:hypothetical protein
LDSVLTAGPDPRGRSRITNKVRASPLGLDGRSERGRRWRDIIDGLIREYGPSEVDKLRELATLKLSLEATQSEPDLSSMPYEQVVRRARRRLSRPRPNPSPQRLLTPANRVCEPDQVL